MKLYKVLVNGRSCHGGALEWSLPKDVHPGEWHEVAGEVVQCENGLHLTDAPAYWWLPNCQVYEVEADGVVGDSSGPDRKCAAKRVRLLREVVGIELHALNIFTEGTGSATSGRVIAYDSASVEAYDSALVRAYDSASVEAYDSASVRASNSVTVVTWRGCKAVKLTDQAVWIDRTGDVLVVHNPSNPEKPKRRRVKK